MSHNLKKLLLLVYLFGWLQTSKSEMPEVDKYLKQLKKEAYEKYFALQELIYKDLLKLGIPGIRPLNIDEVLAEEIVANCSNKVNAIISNIERGIPCDNQKNIILHGMSGTGKSCIAQAIAIKTKTPCLFFNAGSISAEYVNSGVQNLDRIFQYAEWLEKILGKPCIIIFDELEALTKKHADKNNEENNILISFWQQLENLNISKVIVVGIMDGTKDLPNQITKKTSIIEIPLPELKQREAILSYYLNTMRDKHGLIYSESVTPANLARQTKGFSKKDLQNLVEKATMPVIKLSVLPNINNKTVWLADFMIVIKQIKKNLNCGEFEKLFAHGDIQVKPTDLAILFMDHGVFSERDIDPLMIDKLVKLFIAQGCDLNELCAFKEYEDWIDPEFMLYNPEEEIILLELIGFHPVLTQVLIDNGAQVCVNNRSALINIVAILEQEIQEELQGDFEKFFECTENYIGPIDFGKAIAIMFKATTDQDRANFLAQYPKIASILKLA